MTLRTGRTDARRGLALIEVLIAVVILFVGIVAVLRVCSGAAVALDSAESTLGAAMATAEAIESVVLVKPESDPVSAVTVKAVIPGYHAALDSRRLTFGGGLDLREYRVSAGRQGRAPVVVATTLALLH